MDIAIEKKSRVKKCGVCRKQFSTQVASELYCSDECKAEMKRIRAREHVYRSRLIRQRQRREQKEKLRSIRDLSGHAGNAEAIATKIDSIKDSERKVPAFRKPHRKSNNCVGIPRSTSQHKKRVCLKCDKLFDSTGKGNRICASCDRANASVCGRETKYTPERSIFKGDY